MRSKREIQERLSSTNDAFVIEVFMCYIYYQRAIFDTYHTLTQLKYRDAKRDSEEHYIKYNEIKV